MKKHRFTKEDNKILLTQRDTPPKEIRDAYFPLHSVAGVACKLGRLLANEKFNNRTAWKEWEVSHLAANINMKNKEIQKTLFRPTDQINAMRWAIRHNKLPKKLVRRIEDARVLEGTNTLPVKVIGTDFGNINQQVRQIANDAVRKAAEAELQQALRHFSNVKKLLDVNELVRLN